MLENYQRKERVTVEEFTIEHVLPQNPNLSSEWRAELGPDWQGVQARLLHTLGNLTLTGYNSELSDRPFQEKRDMVGGFRDSPLRLNRSLGQREHWDDVAILERGGELADAALRIWTYPQLPQGMEASPTQVRLVGKSDEPLEEHVARWRAELVPLFLELRKRVLNTDASVEEVVNARYVAYRAERNFLTVRGRQNGLLLKLLIPLDELQDPAGLAAAQDDSVTRVMLTAAGQLDAVLELVCQAFESKAGVADHGEVGDALDDDQEREAIEGAEEVTVDGVRLMLRRIPIPDGQRQLYAVLYRANGEWVDLPHLATEIARGRREMTGVLGALGRRINDTAGLGRDLEGNRRGVSAILDVEWPSISETREWRYRMTPVLRKALEAEGLVP